MESKDVEEVCLLITIKLTIFKNNSKVFNLLLGCNEKKVIFARINIKQ